MPPNVIRKICCRKKRALILVSLAVCCILWLTSSNIPAAWGQLPDLSAPKLSLEKLNAWLDFQGRSSNIDTAALRLDGRRLFLITAPKISEDASASSPAPIKQRIKEIEFKLRKFVKSDFNPDTLKVTYLTQNGLPVIYANNQPLLTITVEDAEIYGVDLQRRAEDVTALFQVALVRAQQERQPDFLWRQVGIAGLILGGVVAVSWLTSRLQRYIRARRRKLSKEVTPDSGRSALSTDPKTPTTAAVTTALKQSSKQKRQRLHAFQQELLQIWQICLWMTGVFLILGLFPQTRWMQLFLITGIRLPLQLVGVGVGIYLAIRLSTVLIDHFFRSLEDTDFFSPETAQKLLTPESVQRLALRISTLSQVLKNIAAIILTIAGLLVALSVMGAPLGPLVAGAGVIGIAISFAAQSVLKDSINGFLILFEDQYGVGDWITVGEFSGSVEHMGLRITQLRDVEGMLITIPNGDIRAVKNQSKNWSRVDINVPIAYGADLMKAMQLMDKIAWEIHQDADWKNLILEPPELKGADDFCDRGVIVKLWIKTQPLEQWRVAREYRRRLKLAFDQAGIPLPLPQQVLWVKPQTILNLSNPADE